MIEFFISAHNLGNKCNKIERISDNGESEMFEIQDETFNEKPLYYSNTTARYIYSSMKGFWTVIQKYGI